ncbi:MAG TPA: class I SAM-dependent methyltransferase [Pyrinomonadaceae bacterium]|nr:class I SAM-dependent methyltransferase [Pyrinomonadaceae bacterium]
MSQSEATTSTGLPDSPVSIYDRFTALYDLMFRVNGYGRSIEKYLRERLPPLPADARLLDAGCGTGLLTLALLRVLKRPFRLTAVDLSERSLQTACRAARRLHSGPGDARPPAHFVRADALHLPFADETFDFVVTSGVLEYLPLRDGFAELARVTRPGGHLLYLPVRPSPASRVLEIMFRFKAHPPAEFTAETARHFTLVEEHKFSALEPIGWTKRAVLARKH